MNLSTDDNTSTNTVNQLIKCLARYFLYLECIITQWQGSPLISDELHNYLLSYNVATSQWTPYNPRGNGQVEHYNDIISNTVNLALNLHDKQEELVYQMYYIQLEHYYAPAQMPHLINDFSNFKGNQLQDRLCLPG